jgi:hypothetical protein
MTGQSSPVTVTALSVCLKWPCRFKIPAKCEIRAVIRFLHAKGETAAEIHRQLLSVYAEDVMNRQNVAKRCREFEAGRSDIHNKIRSGRPSVVTDKIIQKCMKAFVLTDV